MTSNAMRCPCGTLDLPLEVTSSSFRISGHMIFAQDVDHRCSEALHMPYKVHVPTLSLGNTSKVADLLDTVPRLLGKLIKDHISTAHNLFQPLLFVHLPPSAHRPFFVGLVTFLYPINPVMMLIAVLNSYPPPICKSTA
ncbi:hypothetical protein DFH07DRAFT_948100 [Mycena maculata]|uniref:Uncharacterized protein n=1 Tax=Mycena maculata TaxID=230809 RepID=A0AAD7KHV6_9AGAR|nr:hypothetical protein DFH07DRAFT_948100 [Mycena maculata]